MRFGGQIAEMYEEYGFEPLLMATNDPAVLIFVSSIMFCVAIISCLYPAYRVFKLEPLKGIRHT
jgi:ABC-type antimicrobial peptide transport system permease subunit